MSWVNIVKRFPVYDAQLIQGKLSVFKVLKETPKLLHCVIVELSQFKDSHMEKSLSN